MKFIVTASTSAIQRDRTFSMITSDTPLMIENEYFFKLRLYFKGN